MMPNPPLDNRTMFWRIVRRMLSANRSRLLVLLLALGAGAAITSALLNLQVDAKRRLTKEFRAFGPNVMVLPRGSENATLNAQTMSGDVLKQIPRNYEGTYVPAEPFLYVLADVSTEELPPTKVVIVGTTAMGVINSLNPSWKVTGGMDWNGTNCAVGSAVASHLHLSDAPRLNLAVGKEVISCQAVMSIATGGAEDNEVFANLKDVQRLISSPGRISLIQVMVPGAPSEIDRYIASLQRQLPDAEVHPIRQFTEAEGKIYNRIGGLLTSTVVLVLVLTALCVMAGMTNAAMERKNDVGLMKAIGGATRRVMRIFLAEAAVLGLIGGMLGAAAGILLSIWLGQAVFGVAARPRLIVYPVSVVLTIIVAIAGALPLRRLASIRPASVFRGEA
jgi:putative ABC transport system permease protein